MATTQQLVAKCVVATALRGVNVRGSIHYTQSGSRWMGINRHIKGPSQPSYADCSSYTTWLMWQARVRVRHSAGRDVVNGLSWSAGYTGTQTSHGKRHSNIRYWVPGQTLVFYGHPVSHVAVYVGHGKVVSHGSESGPLYLPWNYRGDFNQARLYNI